MRTLTEICAGVLLVVAGFSLLIALGSAADRFGRLNRFDGQYAGGATANAVEELMYLAYRPAASTVLLISVSCLILRSLLRIDQSLGILAAKAAKEPEMMVIERVPDYPDPNAPAAVRPPPVPPRATPVTAAQFLPPRS